MNAISRSWDLTKLSFGVIGKDKELLLFPLIAFILSVAFLLGLAYPTVLAELADDGSAEMGFLQVAILFVTYLGMSFIGTFSNMCVVFTAKTRFEGGDATFGQSIGYTMKRLHLVLAWATVSATVGLIFRGLDELAERAGPVGAILISILRTILGMAWGAITLFVIPSMVYRGLTPIPAIKDSIRVLKDTWGESLVRSVGFGFVQFLVIVAGGAVFAGVAKLTADVGGAAVPVTLIIGFVVFVLAVVLVFSVARTVFNTALYHYASSGQVADGYTQEVMTGAFRNKG